eukprot:Transcript_1979.p1 GENE.Transcript_1979~~Transcript_1979.p1  ORF type:complete len:273 (-),score=16.91 Transcript_1979:191-1009(-)
MPADRALLDGLHTSTPEMLRRHQHDAARRARSDGRSSRSRHMHTIALIADTHGWLAPRVCPTLAREGVTELLHAGDVGPGKKAVEQKDLREGRRSSAGSLIAALEEVLPMVRAVRGNTDNGHDLPATLIHQVGDVRFIVHHGDQIRWQDDDAVLAALRPEGGWRETGDVIVSGHSHVPRFVRHPSGVLFLNPGTAGGPSETTRFVNTFPQQYAIVRCSGTTFEVSAIDLQSETGEVHAWAEGEPSPCPVASRKRKRAMFGMQPAGGAAAGSG